MKEKTQGIREESEEGKEKSKMEQKSR